MNKRLCTLLVAALLGALTGCDFRFLGGDLDGLLLSAERYDEAYYVTEDYYDPWGIGYGVADDYYYDVYVEEEWYEEEWYEDEAYVDEWYDDEWYWDEEDGWYEDDWYWYDATSGTGTRTTSTTKTNTGTTGRMTGTTIGRTTGTTTTGRRQDVTT